jgi:hypothetical protein
MDKLRSRFERADGRVANWGGKPATLSEIDTQKATVRLGGRPFGQRFDILSASGRVRVLRKHVFDCVQTRRCSVVRERLRCRLEWGTI